ncbi:hypothetical protein LOK49_LG14G01661 [Camellia lanceoleosa]|uniref:Uncharacterized protein n=1 Tax=Camellia lanceoleosa TaxID=1840588 RepID=A0ACC0FF33_9ERIC|nr:hypothetical protein LOK49_LG14G01661 [Camellia lanceoleosa]
MGRTTLRAMTKVVADKIAKVRCWLSGRLRLVMFWRSCPQQADRAQVPWKGPPERGRAPAGKCPSILAATTQAVAKLRVVWGNAALNRAVNSAPRYNTGERPTANKYREGKMKRTSVKRESKSALKLLVEGSGWGRDALLAWMWNGAQMSADRLGAWTGAGRGGGQSPATKAPLETLSPCRPAIHKRSACIARFKALPFARPLAGSRQNGSVTSGKGLALRAGTGPGPTRLPPAIAEAASRWRERSPLPSDGSNAPFGGPSRQITTRNAKFCLPASRVPGCLPKEKEFVRIAAPMFASPPRGAGEPQHLPPAVVLAVSEARPAGSYARAPGFGALCGGTRSPTASPAFAVRGLRPRLPLTVPALSVGLMRCRRRKEGMLPG